MQTFKKIHGNFLLTLALALPLAAQAPATEAQKLEQALEHQRQAFGENSAAYAAALVDLARVYQATGKRSADAMQLYRQALPIQESTLGPNHPDVATTLLSLALGTPQKAEHREEVQQLLERALDIRTRAFGASDMRVAEILTPLARLTGDEGMYQRALVILDAVARESSAAATTLELYSHFLRAQDRAGEAEPMEARAKQIRTTRVSEIGSRRGAPGPSPLRVGGGVTPPKLKEKIEPEYSEMARAGRLQGTVVLALEVGVDGLAHNIQLRRGIGLGLDEKAAEAVSKWLFTPGTKDGQAVTVMATVEVNFRLM